MSTEDLLHASLAAAVPLWIEELRQLPAEEIIRRRRLCVDAIAHKGDLILYRSRKKGESAAAFNRLAEGLACLAFAPGGVTFLGMHFKATP